MNISFTLKALLAIGILSVSAIAQANVGFSATWRVQKYDLDVDIPRSETSREVSINAKIDVKNVSNAPATSLTLRLSNNASVSTVAINGNNVDFANTEEKVSSAVSLRRIAIRVPSVAIGSTLTANVTYKLNIRDNSGVASISPAGGHLLPSSFWYPTPNSWFFSRGVDAAATRIKANVPDQISFQTAGKRNGAIVETALNIQPFIFWGQWNESQIDGVTVLVPKGIANTSKMSEATAKVFREAIANISNISGGASVADLRIIATRRGGGFGTGGTVVIDEAVFRRDRLDPATVLSIAESAGRTWIGNTAMPTGDGFGIVGEGLVRFLSNEFVEKQFGKEVAEAERTRQRNAYTSVSRRDGPMILATPIDDFYFPVVANKGAMFWRSVHRRFGAARFNDVLMKAAADRELSIAEFRLAYESEKTMIDGLLDQVTETNLLVGRPSSSGTDTKVAVRNTGNYDVSVQVEALMENGSAMSADVAIRASSFGEVTFKAPSKIVRVEIDPDKLIPQIDYSDDVAPRETTDSDPVLAVKKIFDRQEFDAAAKLAAMLLRNDPQLDDLRALYGRALLAKNDLEGAERQFKSILDQTIATPRSLAWASVGMAEIRSRSGANAEAAKFATDAIKMDGETGASLTARILRNRIVKDQAIDQTIRAFFSAFDRGASTNRKAEIDQLIVPGDVTRFAAGVAGSTEQWQTNIVAVDRLDDDTVLVEALMNIRLLTRQPETGTAVFRLKRIGGNWKLAAVDVFEVR